MQRLDVLYCACVGLTGLFSSAVSVFVLLTNPAGLWFVLPAWLIFAVLLWLPYGLLRRRLWAAFIFAPLHLLFLVYHMHWIYSGAFDQRAVGRHSQPGDAIEVLASSLPAEATLTSEIQMRDLTVRSYRASSVAYPFVVGLGPHGAVLWVLHLSEPSPRRAHCLDAESEIVFQSGSQTDWTFCRSARFQLATRYGECRAVLYHCLHYNHAKLRFIVPSVTEFPHFSD